MERPEAIIKRYLGSIAYRKYDSDVLDIPAFTGSIPSPSDRILPGQVAYMMSDVAPMDKHARELKKRQTAQAQVVRLPHSPVAELGGWSELVRGRRNGVERLSLTLLEKLACILNYSARGLRWEPFNTYQVHRGIASARCLFPCNVRVMIKSPESGEYSIYKYINDDHALAKIGDAPVINPSCGEADVVIAVSGDLARCMVPYGDFAPNLTLPEAGLLLNQIALFGAAVGWNLRIPPVTDSAGLGRLLGIECSTELVLGICCLDDSIDELGDWQLSTLDYMDFSPLPGGLESFAKLEELVSAFHAATLEGVARTQGGGEQRQGAFAAGHAGDEEGSDVELVEVAERRNSGCYRIGLAPVARGFRSDTFLSIVDDWIGAARICAQNSLDAISVRGIVALLRADDCQPAVFDIEFPSGSFGKNSDEDLSERLSLSSTMPLSNFRELNFVVTLMIDFAEEFRKRGARAYIEGQIATGWVCHALAMAVGRQNMFARPVRMYDDPTLDNAVGLKGQAAIQISCGRNRDSQLWYNLL